MSFDLQNSLTSPLDKDISLPNSFSLSTSNILTDTDVQNAMKELNIDNFVKKFPRFEKFYVDPPLVNQTYSLISFVPSKGATPDKDGVFGMVKVRGVFSTIEEANLQAERLIRNVDSYHSIFQTLVGRPFPLASSKKYILETKEIDVIKKNTEINSDEIRRKRDEEKNEAKDMERRQEELLADTDEKKLDDPYELYTETMVKKAHLQWTYHNTMKKLEDMKKTIIGARQVIQRMDTENPDYRNQYLGRYMKAREKSGLPNTDDTFIKYLGEDIDLGF
jgi:hypothetical protein